MKKIKLFVLITLLPLITIAQGGIEIVPFVGYMFGGSVKFYEGKLKLTDGLDYGASLIIPVQDILDIELNYTGMSGTASFEAYTNYPDFSDEETGVTTNYMQLGVVKYILLQNPKIQPFGSFSLGATLFKLADYTDTWRFSVTLGAGVKIMFSDRVGIMLRGRMLMPMTFNGVGGYCGIGTGGSSCGLSMNGYVQPFQGDFNGGLVFVLGGN